MNSAVKEVLENKTYPFELIREVKFPRKNKDGSFDRRKSNKVAGQTTEVYAFRTQEEIAAILDVLDRYIAESKDEDKRRIAHRNKLLFLIGINIGIRASDLRTLKWEFFFECQNEELTWKKFYVLQPQKQKAQKKFVKLFFNQAVKTAIDNYISEYPIDDLNEFLFASRKGDKPIEVGSLWRIIKNAAEEAGIRQNIGSHSLRKTFGFWCWHNAPDKDKALVILQQIFSHSSTQVTSRYIGILDDEMEDMFNSIELGLSMIGGE